MKADQLRAKQKAILRGDEEKVRLSIVELPKQIQTAEYHIPLTKNIIKYGAPTKTLSSSLQQPNEDNQVGYCFLQSTLSLAPF